jgi:hypothetical protein
MDLRPHTPWEASLAIWTKCPEACLSRSCSQEPGHRPSSQGGTNANFGLTRFQTNAPEVLGNNKGSKVTETIFTGSREFITIVNLGEIILKALSPDLCQGLG